MPFDTISNPPAPSIQGGGRRRILAIVGSHTATRELAPYDDPGAEIWLFNESAQKPEVYRRWDALLQIHGEAVYTSPDNWVNPDHWKWLQQDHGTSTVTGERKRIWMQAVDPRVPNSVKYPLDEILNLTPYRYLRSSPAMALALAIYLDEWDEIQLYGSELSSNTEYAYQATNYAFWIGFAHGRGINLQLHCWESEFTQRVYGFDGEFDIDRAYFAERYELAKAAWTESERAIVKMKNRSEIAMAKFKPDDLAQISIDLENAAQASGEAAGAMAEAERYKKRRNSISRQEFERTAARAQMDYNPQLQNLYHCGGKLEYVWNVWRMSGRNEPLSQVRTFLKEKIHAAYDTGVKKGIYQENILYMTEYDTRLTAAGGTRALGKAPAEN